MKINIFSIQIENNILEEVPFLRSFRPFKLVITLCEKKTKFIIKSNQWKIDRETNAHTCYHFVVFTFQKGD